MKNFIGQNAVKEGIQILLDAENIVPHILLMGQGGTGKTALAKMVANAKANTFHCANGATIKSIEDIKPYIYMIEEGDVVFIDEIHRMPIKCQEVLYTVMEDFEIAVASSHGEMHDIPKFTLIGATTDAGKLTGSFKDRFKAHFMLELYSNDDIHKIIDLHNYKKFDVDTEYLSCFSRGVPRRAIAHLEWVLTYCKAKCLIKADKKVIDKALALQGTYENGITKQDLNYMGFLFRIKQAASIQSIIGATCLDKQIIENSIEPYLIQNAFITKTARGRCLNFKKYKDLIEKIQS